MVWINNDLGLAKRSKGLTTRFRVEERVKAKRGFGLERGAKT